MNKDQNFKSITRIGFVVNNIEQSAKSWAELLEMDIPDIMLSAPLDEAHTIYKEKPTDAQAKLAFFQLENITIELIEPVGDDIPWKETMDEKGEGIHHIAFNVKDMENAIAFLREAGGKLVQRGDFAGGSYTYMDMTAKLATNVELLSTTK